MVCIVSRIQCLKDSGRFVFDPKSGEIESLPCFFNVFYEVEALMLGIVLGTVG